MVVESTQEYKGTGKPAASVTPAAIGDDNWSAAESAHKELMRLDDTEAAGSPLAAAPPPPGETEPPPPGKNTKGAGSNDVKSPTQEAKPNQTPQAQSKPEPTSGPAAQPQATKPPAPRPVSEAKVKLQESLPALADDSDVGQEKEQTVPRDGKADLGFTGKLLGSTASSAPKGMWQELRIYSTTSGKHVFSRVTRTIFADENDKHEAEVFEPSPTSVPSQLLRSAREMTRSRPFTWMDAAVAFFGYDPLAKVLYRKLSVDFEERV
jgi:hypothetical protein